MPSLRTVALLLSLAAATAACARRPAAPRPSRSYLFVWAGADSARGGASDFLGVIDADTASPTYAMVVATAPVGAAGTMAHHTEMVMPAPGQWLFANGFMAGRTWLFDLADPLRPRVAATIDSVPGFVKPHSFWRLPDGDVLSTLQYGDGRRPGNPGGLVLFSPRGGVLRSASAADPAFPGAPIRTYSLDVAPAADRAITTSAPMDDVPSADVVQVWRVSDLTLLKTLAVPALADSTSRWPFEVRFLPGDSLAFLNTYSCGLYLLSRLTTPAPRLEHVLSLPKPQAFGCGVPLLVGHWWILPVGRAHRFLVFDIADPRHARQAGELATDTTFHPHWMAREPGSDRVVLTSGTGDQRVLLARFDSATGALAWDSTFRDPGAARLGVDFARTTWPHGTFGPAMPHAAIFSAPARP